MPKGRSNTSVMPAIRLFSVDCAASETASPATPAPVSRPETGTPRRSSICLLYTSSTAKLHKKNMDMIVANNLKVPGAGFGVDTNVVTIITAQGVTELPLQSKDAVAGHIADAIAGK